MVGILLSQSKQHILIHTDSFYFMYIHLKRYLCLIAQSGVQHILCCAFNLFFFVLCALCVASFSGLSIYDCPLGIL